MPSHELTLKQIEFCTYYMSDLEGDAIAAYQKVFDTSHLTPKQLSHRASNLLGRKHIKEHIADLRRRLRETEWATVINILGEWVKIATADPAELIKVAYYNCRYCYGKDHAYQWTKAEYVNKQTERALAGKTEMPPATGGFGFDGNRDPNPKCPICFGRGVREVQVADLRRVSGNARKLYAGLVEKNNGIEIKMRDQDKAIENLAKYLGMFNNDLNAASSSPAKNVVLEKVSLLTSDPTEASKIYQRYMRGD